MFKAFIQSKITLYYKEKSTGFFNPVLFFAFFLGNKTLFCRGTKYKIVNHLREKWLGISVPLGKCPTSLAKFIDAVQICLFATFGVFVCNC